MARTYIAGIGWIDVEGPEKEDGTLDQQQLRDNAYGSPKWVAENFPEYADVNVAPKKTTGPEGGTRVTRTVPLGNDVVRQAQPWTALGFRELWESTPPEERGALADSLNFYKNGGKDANGNPAVDPHNFSNLQYKGENPQGRKIFTNDKGTLLGGHHPIEYREDRPDLKGQEYGINAQWTGKDGTTFSPKYYATVIRDFSPDARYSGIGKMVPGWNNIARNLGLDSYRQSTNLWDPQPRNWEFSGMDVGESVYGNFGFMHDKEVKDRRAQRDNRTSTPGGTQPVGSGGGGSGGGGSTPGGGGGDGGNFPGGSPTGPGQTPSGPPVAPGTGAPPRNPWEEDNSGAGGRGPTDYGPAPFDPNAPPSGGSSYSGYGSSGADYNRPIFGGDSQWRGMYQDWLGGGIDISKYAPEMGGAPSVAQQQSQQPVTVPAVGNDGGTAGPGDYYGRYNQWITG